MKGSRSVCLACRYRLATRTSKPTSTPPPTVSTARPTQQHTRAHFATSSLRYDGTSSRTASIAPEGPWDPATPREAATTSPPPGPVRIRKFLAPNHAAGSRDSGLKRPPPQKHPAQLNALFQQIVTEQQSFDKDGEPTGTPATISSADLAHVHADIARLYEMVEDGPPQEAYVYLKTVIYPALRQPPPIFYKVVLDLMRKMVSAKKANMLDPNLPTVAEIFQTYADIGKLKPREWADLVGDLVHTLVSMRPPTDDDPSAEGVRNTQAALLTDVIESWKVLSAPKFYNVTAASSQHGEMFDGFWFPSFNKFTVRKFGRSNDFIGAFNAVFPQYDQAQLGPPVAALTIATYVLLQDRALSNDDARRSTARFTSNVAYLITHVGVEDDSLDGLMSVTFPSLRDYVMGCWPRAKSLLKQYSKATTEIRVHPARRPSSGPQTGLQTKTQTETQTSYIHPSDYNPFLAARLDKAYLARNLGEVDRIWQEFVGKDKVFDQQRIDLLRNKLNLIDAFVNVFMALAQPQKAMAAWGLYKKIGLSPTLKTWNAMLDGCKKNKNLPALKNVWAKLMSSGIELDTHIWTTRISGLVDSGDIEAGAAALDEMARLWKQAQAGERPHAVRPTIEPVNAALAGLQKTPLGPEMLLDWAGRQGIKPDIFTYNTLLRPMIREGRNKDARKLFDMMRKQGVSADAATFTIVLDAALTRIDSSLSPEEFDAAQKETVAHVLSQMEAVGLETNLFTYGKMIYLLLQSGGRSREAVKAVLAHLWEQGFELSPHIYTMLVEHYFAQRPPDLASVDALLQRQRLFQKAGTGTNNDALNGGTTNAGAGNDLPEMDRVFHDRVVKGYALAADDPGRALDLFYRLSERGYLVTLGTQADVLVALLRHGRWDDARALVDHTRRRFRLQNPEDLYGGGSSSKANNNGFWQHGFWVVAEQNQLLEKGWEKSRELA